jgi:hypothetical protein
METFLTNVLLGFVLSLLVYIAGELNSISKTLRDLFAWGAGPPARVRQHKMQRGQEP